MGSELDWNTSGTAVPLKNPTEYRQRLTALYEKAIEELYKNDTQTVWYDENGTFPVKPDTLFGSIHTQRDHSYYGKAADVINDAWNDIGGFEGAVAGEDALEEQALVDRFKSGVLTVATKDYQRFLEQKLLADAKWSNEEDPVVDDEYRYVLPSDEQEKAAAEESAAAANAAADRIRAAAQEAAGAAGATGATGAAQASIVSIKDQCFLLAYLFDIIDAKKTSIDTTERKKIPYHEGDGNACLMAHAEPFGFMNALTQYPSQATLMNLTSAELAALQPKVELYKVSTDRDGKEISIPIEFDSFLGSTRRNIGTGQTETMFKNKRKRGYGAGLQNFTFSYEGNNPFAVKKSIKAKLSIFANTFDELMEPRGATGQEYTYIDLALKTGGLGVRPKSHNSNPQDDNKDHDSGYKFNFRLQAVVGWQPPAGSTGIVSATMRDALKESSFTLNLTPVIHNFDFDEQGRVKFEIDYWAFVEDFFNQPVYSIFADPEVMKNVVARRLKYTSLEKVCKASEVAEMRKKDKEAMIKDKKAALSWVLRMVTKQKALRYISIPQASLATIAKEGPYANKKALKFDISTIAADTPEADKVGKDTTEIVAGKFKELPPKAFSKQITGGAGDHPIIFFFVSDLLDIILEGIGNLVQGMADKMLPEIKAADKEGHIDSNVYLTQLVGFQRLHHNFQRLRVLLGPVEIVNPINPAESKFINLGDLPVSFKYFMEFLTDKTIKGDKVFYPLPTFLNEFFNVFLRSFLNNDTCFERTPGMQQKVRISQATVTDYKRMSATLDTISSLLVLAAAGPQQRDPPVDLKEIPAFVRGRQLDVAKYKKQSKEPILNISGHLPGGAVTAENDYLIYYASRAQPVRNMQGDLKTDTDAGVFHYAIGKDRGLVRNIQLTRTDMPGMKEVRFEQGGYDGLEQLREVYNVEIDCFANVTAFPGTYIFVDPLGFAPSMKYDVEATSQGCQEGDQFDLDNLTDYGLGGYYMIIRSQHSFGPGKAHTSITARWVQEIEKPDDALSCSDPKAVDDNKESPSKCTVGPNSERETKVQTPEEILAFEAETGMSGDVMTAPVDENLMDPFY